MTVQTAHLSSLLLPLPPEYHDQFTVLFHCFLWKKNPQTHKGRSNQRLTGIKLSKEFLFFHSSCLRKRQLHQGECNAELSLSGILREALTWGSVIQITVGGPGKFGWIRKKVRHCQQKKQRYNPKRHSWVFLSSTATEFLTPFIKEKKI